MKTNKNGLPIEIKYCKKCVGIRQFLGDPRKCDVCGDEG